ncbi:glycosyl hydrolase family 71-domain-containing protein [Neurospora crassa]|nr:glycosyl hydrolase family 71-domain-containing protein [Neurospora crassa]
MAGHTLSSLLLGIIAICLWAGHMPGAHAVPVPVTNSLDPRQSAADKLVFAHFMIGIVGNRGSSADYDYDMQKAKAIGIDAFALNIGVDGYTDTQLGFAYESAARNGMKVFISFDFNWWHPSTQATDVGRKIAQYASLPAQLKIDGKVFASSFIGDGLDVAQMKAAAGVDVFRAPNFNPSQTPNNGVVDSAFNWMAWPNNGANKAPQPGHSFSVADGDNAYKAWLGSKPYMAPISPWFSTHFGPEVSYSKNWVFPGDLLWYSRWNEILTLGPRYVEIISWNDYGESHYIGPLDSKHTDDGNSKWVNDMPHEGWMELAKPFIAAYKAGASKPDAYISQDQIIYWYRPTLKSLNCDATDTTMQDANNSSGNYFKGRPNGYETMEDAVFVVSLLKTAGQIKVTSGGNSAVTYRAPAGAYAQKVPMGVGKQRFELIRNGQSVLSGTSPRDVSNTCPCGIYNFNAFVGQLPFKPFGSLDSQGLASLTVGLHVSTCQPTPTLIGSAPPPNDPRPTDPPAMWEPPSIPRTISTQPITTAPPPSTPTSCNRDTVTDESPNLTGLCNFLCFKGWCPPGPCKCHSFGTPGWSDSNKAPWLPGSMSR